MKETTLSIGQVAALIGVRASALRFYEDIGLLTPVQRAGGKRRYDAGAVDQLRLIRFCQEVGFSLAEIRKLLSAPRGRPGKRRWRELVDEKLVEVERSIQKAEAMKRILEESRDCDCVAPHSCDFITDVVGPFPRDQAPLGAEHDGS